MKKSSIIIIAIVLAVAIIVGLLAVWIVGIPQIIGGKKILIEDASLDWEYDDMYFDAYVLNKVTVRFKNVGGTEVSGVGLYVRGQANWHVESGYSDTFKISGGHRLKPGETRTVSDGGGIVIKQSGTYTLTLQVIGGWPTATEVLGESTMTIQVP